MTGWVSDPISWKPKIKLVEPYRDTLYPMYLRDDPLYDIEWRNLLDLEFRDVGAEYQGVGLAPNSRLVVTSERSFFPITIHRQQTHGRDHIRIAAMLIQFHHMTTWQIASMSGLPTTTVKRALAQLYIAGVVAQADATWESSSMDEDTVVWRFNTGYETALKWLDALTPIEYLLITGNGDLAKTMPASRNKGGVRHNLVGAEIALRALESCPGIAGSWGERASDSYYFLSSNDAYDDGVRRNIGDMSLVTKNGEVIVLELVGAANIQAGSGDLIRKKMMGWARIAALSSVPIKAIAVSLSPNLKLDVMKRDIAYGIKESMSSMFASATMREKAIGSIFLASAYDWFPQPQSISEGFTKLQSWSPLTRQMHDLVNTDTPWADEASVVNTVAALHTPDWSMTKVA